MAGRIQRYTRLKNEVLELLARGVLTHRQTRIAIVVIRESWGWNAGRSNWTYKPLTVTEIAKKTGINKAHASRELQEMIERNILQIKPQEMGTYYSFNEHENTWKKAYKRSKKATAHDPKEQQLIQKSNKGLPKEQQLVAERATATPFKPRRGAGSGDRKERSKERSKEKDLSRRFSDVDMDLAKRLRDWLLRNKPDAKVPDSLAEWADVMRLMRERDNRTPERIAEVIDWCQQDDFWRINIRSASKLRIQFDQLELKMDHNSKKWGRTYGPQAPPTSPGLFDHLVER